VNVRAILARFFTSSKVSYSVRPLENTRYVNQTVSHPPIIQPMNALSYRSQDKHLQATEHNLRIYFTFDFRLLLDVVPTNKLSHVKKLESISHF